MNFLLTKNSSTNSGFAMKRIKILPNPMSELRIAEEQAALFSSQGVDDAFFVVNVDRVLAQHEEWRSLLPRVKPHYAVKCNNDPVLLRCLASLGCGFDCASKREIEDVLAIPDVSPDSIIYANPCKTRSYITHARTRGVARMTFDGEEELHKIRALYPTAEMVLRIAVSDPTAVCPLNVKFGCDPVRTAPSLLSTAMELGLRVVGISFHVGSGCRDPTAFSVAIAHARRLFLIGEELGHSMRILDVGGGFPGFPTEEIDFPTITGVINEALETHFPEGAGSREVEIIAEPGRFYAAAAFTLCCSVIAKTRVPGSKITGRESDEGEEGVMYYLNDGVYGSFNCILYDHFSPTGRKLMGEERERSVEEVWSSVWGPTCDGLDQILAQVRLPRMTEGDWMVFENMGAYTAAAGSEFNGFPRPSLHYFISECCEERLELFKQEDSGEDGRSEEGSSSSCSSAICSSSEETDQE